MRRVLRDASEVGQVLIEYIKVPQASFLASFAVPPDRYEQRSFWRIGTTEDDSTVRGISGAYKVV